MKGKPKFDCYSEETKERVKRYYQLNGISVSDKTGALAMGLSNQTVTDIRGGLIERGILPDRLHKPRKENKRRATH